MNAPKIGAGLPPAANQTTPNSEVINLPPLYIQWTFTGGESGNRTPWYPEGGQIYSLLKSPMLLILQITLVGAQRIKLWLTG